MKKSLFDLADALRMTHHLVSGLPKFLLQPVDGETCRSSLAERLRTREARFLRLMEIAVYPFPDSPYHKLLKAAGCDLGDVVGLVRERGLEGGLERLREAGVYLTLDEFKARSAAHRGSQVFRFNEDEFDNPRLHHHFEVKSGGTRSAGTRTMIDLEFIAAMAADTTILFDVHGLWPLEQAIWLPLGGTALVALMIYARLGRAPSKWFSQVDGRSSQLSFKYRMGTNLMLRYGGLFGRKLPQPEFVPVYGAEQVVRWLADLKQKSRAGCVTTFASSAVRICDEARRRGLDIRGAAFITIGEPLSAARREMIEATGATAVCRYAITEAGILGYACGEPSAPDDLHLLRTNLALIQAKRKVRHDAIVVDATYITSLLPTAPKILINVETGDYGIVENRDCNCGFGRLGYSTHISAVRSFEKLTGEGVTFAGADLVRIIDEVLPEHFGGSGIDYQVLEEEGPGGMSQLYLLIHPELGEIDEAAVVRCFLAELGRQSEAQRIMAEIWNQSATVRVRRQRPIGTRAGKVLPFHLATAQTRAAAQGTSDH